MDFSHFSHFPRNPLVLRGLVHPGPVPRGPTKVRTMSAPTHYPGTTTTMPSVHPVPYTPQHVSHSPGEAHQASFGYSRKPKIPICAKPPLFWCQKLTCQNWHFLRKSLPKPHSFWQNPHFWHFWRKWWFLTTFRDTTGLRRVFTVSEVSGFPIEMSKKCKI